MNCGKRLQQFDVSFSAAYANLLTAWSGTCSRIFCPPFQVHHATDLFMSVEVLQRVWAVPSLFLLE